MKKLLAVLLALICVFTMAPMTLAASDNLIGDVIEDYLGVTQEEGEIDQQMMYGIHYEMEPISLVSIMYKPNPTITFQQPVVAKVTMDTPLSVDYEFVCWRHGETGKHYYPGDEIEVTGVVTLYAIWEEKSDDSPRFIRVITTALETLNRLLKKFLGIYENFQESESEYYETTTVPSTAQ